MIGGGASATPAKAPVSRATKPVLAHANSLSETRAYVEDERVRLDMRWQTLSLLEALPHLDSNFDGRLDRRECQLAEDLVEDYIANTLFVRIDGSDEPGTGARLDGELLRFKTAESLPVLPQGPLPAADASLPGDRDRSQSQTDGPVPEAYLLDLPQELELSLQFPLSRLPTRIAFELRLFELTSPNHRDLFTLHFEGQRPVDWVFGPGSSHFAFVPEAHRTRKVLTSFARIAARLVAPIHFALVLLLLLAARTRRDTTKILFAVGLSVLAAVLWIAWGGPLPGSRLLELSSLLVVAFVALENLLLKTQRALAPEAFLFGAIQSLSQAPSLQSLLRNEPEKWVGLCGWAAGRSSVLILAGVLVAVLLYGTPGKREPKAEYGSTWAHRWLGKPAALLLSAWALWSFVDRAWF